MSPSRQESLRRIPSIDALLHDPDVRSWADALPPRIVLDALRTAVAEIRRTVANVPDTDVQTLRRQIIEQAAARARSTVRPHYRRAINATGIILHTGLGRAVLAEAAMRQIQRELSGYSLLQVDTETGKRSRRDARIEWLLRALTGTEAATVVNNNAAATSLVLRALCKGREVIVSRGQLVEIGGSFRLPEVMEASGARLVEVGTTNKTHLRDYERAITADTAALLRVHPSNYRIIGFTAEVPLEPLVALAHARGILLIDDVGAGALFDPARLGYSSEPTLPGSIRAGADVVLCSADKLIGASQGGLILGRADLIERVRKNPFARIVRVGKLTLAALEATLTLFLDETRAFAEVPTLRMLVRPREELAAQAERIAAAISARVSAALLTVRTVDGHSEMGSGSLPAQELPTRLVTIRPARLDAGELARRLRRCEPPVFARVHRDHVLIDPRTLLDGEEETVIQAIVSVLETPS